MVRHGQLGQLVIQQLGYRVRDIWQVVQIYNVMMTLPAVDQYALLTTVIEPNGMPEKRINIEHFEMIRDDVAAQAVTYDWSDENNHIRWGKKSTRSSWRRTVTRRRRSRLPVAPSSGCW